VNQDGEPHQDRYGDRCGNHVILGKPLVPG
jgi:hypothetical protein